MEFRVEGLTKRYQKKVVFCEFSCKFGTGVTVLLGANGAGKSTLLNILSTALDMDMGKIFWNGLLGCVSKLGRVNNNKFHLAKLLLYCV